MKWQKSAIMNSIQDIYTKSEQEMGFGNIYTIDGNYLNPELSYVNTVHSWQVVALHLLGV
jgi:hypothetical protein